MLGNPFSGSKKKIIYGHRHTRYALNESRIAAIEWQRSEKLITLLGHLLFAPRAFPRILSRKMLAFFVVRAPLSDNRNQFARLPGSRCRCLSFFFFTQFAAVLQEHCVDLSWRTPSFEHSFSDLLWLRGSQLQRKELPFQDSA